MPPNCCGTLPLTLNYIPGDIKSDKFGHLFKQTRSTYIIGLVIWKEFITSYKFDQYKLQFQWYNTTDLRIDRLKTYKTKLINILFEKHWAGHI